MTEIDPTRNNKLEETNYDRRISGKSYHLIGAKTKWVPSAGAI